MKAAKNGNIDWITELLNDGARVDTKNQDGETALMLAAENGHTECVKILLKNWADVNAKDEDGKTALLFDLFIVVYVSL